jgi:hypothetical protein
MKQFFFVVFLFLGGVVSFYAHSGAPTDGSAVASTSMTSPGTGVVTSADAKKMLTEFQRAQNSELKALDHRNKIELKELKAAHSARQREWERREKEARHKFFSEHTNGPDRRAYIKDFMERRKNFLQLLNDERAQRSHDQEVRVSSLRQDHAQRLKEFQEALKNGQRPAPNLWPSSS